MSHRAQALNTPKADDDTCAAKASHAAVEKNIDPPFDYDMSQASFNDCREGKGQDAELRMLKGSEGSFAGIWCSFHGRATLAAQRNYHGADDEVRRGSSASCIARGLGGVVA